MAISDQEIRDYAKNLGAKLGGAGTGFISDSQAKQLSDAAKQYGVSDSQLNKALGLSGDTSVEAWRSRQKSGSSGGTARSSSGLLASAMSKSTGISDQEVRDYAANLGIDINGNQSGHISDAQAAELYRAANQNGVTMDQLNRSLGLSGDGTAQAWMKRNNLWTEEAIEGKTSLGGIPNVNVTGNMTSQGQLQQMLSSNSPLMKLAATQGKQQAAQRGLLNSSMAGQAAQGAMIANAAPFAQQDAQTYFQNAQANADRYMQDYMSDKQYQQQLGLNEQQFGFDTQKLAQQFTYDSQISQQEANQALNNLYATSTANAWGVMANNLTDLVGQSANAIQQIQVNPDITPENKTTMIEKILEMRDADIKFQQDLYTNLGTYLKNTGVFPNLA